MSDALIHGRAATYRHQGCRCWECTEAASDEHRHQRRKHPHLRERNNAAVRAKGRAMTRLAAMYPNVLRRLEDEERAVEGLPPVGAVPPGRKPKAAS